MQQTPTITPYQRTIALIYDCDMTLTREYMQEPIFRKFNVNGRDFWKENDETKTEAKKNGVSYDAECSYLNLILRYLKKGMFEDLSNKTLRELGKEVRLYDGLPEYFGEINKVVSGNERYAHHEIQLEHYVVSTGIKEMIKGSPIGQHLKDIFACEYNEVDGQIAEIARAVGYTKKTEYFHLINKGGNVNEGIDVNGVLPAASRRIPFEYIVYIGDGFTDVPCFALVNDRKGVTIGVYNPESEKALKQCILLQEQRRTFTFASADYRPGSDLFRLLKATVEKIADKIVKVQGDERAKLVSEVPRA